MHESYSSTHGLPTHATSVILSADCYVLLNSLKAEALKKLLIGFPSIDIPNDSNLYFWQFNGNNFGTEHASNGRFKKENFVKIVENYSIDGGPLIIVHENMKDVVMVSPISTRTFQKYGSR